MKSIEKSGRMILFLQENYLLIILVIGFLLLLNNNLQIENSKTRRIRELLVAVILISIFNSLEYYFSRLDSFHYGRVFCSFVCYYLRPVIVISFISLLTDHKLIRPLKYLTIVNGLIYSTCFFTKLSFYYTSDNIFNRGILGYSAHVLCFFYLMVLVYIIIRKYNPQDKLRTILLVFFVLSSLGAALLDIVVYNIRLFDSVVLICVLLYYLYLNMEFNKIDSLTLVFNRSVFYHDMSIYSSRIKAVISIDMNHLKEINDTYGHQEGDLALQTIAQIFLNYDKKYVRVYRIGGDEFAIFSFHLNEEGVIHYIQSVKMALKKTKYTCSFGYQMNEGQSIMDLYKLADQKMYVEKEKYHSMTQKKSK